MIHFILNFFGGFLTACIFAALFKDANSNIGFGIGAIIYVIVYCCLTAGDPPRNSNLP